MPRKSARIAARQQEQSSDTRDKDNDDGSGGLHLWCSYRQPQGDRFMIECDLRGEKCFHWYHGSCVGITPTEGRRLECQGEPFICPFCTTTPCLPSYSPSNAPNFTWGPSSISEVAFCELVNRAYESIVHWKHNLFLVPYGSVGCRFISELAKLYEGFGSASAMECIALKSAMVLPALLLQKPHARSKSREHVKCLERRLLLWCEGDVDALLIEGQTIQQHLQHSYCTPTTDSSRIFARLVFQG